MRRGLCRQARKFQLQGRLSASVRLTDSRRELATGYFAR